MGEVGPRAEHSDFKSIRVGFKAHIPEVMLLHDKLGQTTRITFDNVKVNPSIPDERFTLDIPDDVTVVNGLRAK